MRKNLKYSIIITVFYLIISPKILAEINLHSKDLHKIQVKHDKNIRYSLPINISFSVNTNKNYFLCVSFGSQLNRNFHNTNSELFLEEKELKENITIRAERSALKRNTKELLTYQLYNSENTNINTELKTFLLAININDVISGTIQEQDSSPSDINIFAKVPKSIYDIIPGIYIDIFSVDLYEGNIEDKINATLIESKDIKIQFEVPYVSLIKEEAKLNDGSRCFYVNSNSRHQISVSQVNEDKPKALEFVKMGPLITFTPDPNEKGYIVIEIQDLE